MKKVASIKFSVFGRLSNSDFITRGNSIHAALQTNSVVFPDLPVTLPVLAGALQDLAYKNAVAEGDDGSTNHRNTRDAQREVVLQMLVALGVYVFGVANTRETYEDKKAIIELAGYTVANDTHNPVVLEPVEGFTAKTSSKPGISTVDLRWKRGKAVAFVVQATQGHPDMPSTVWQEMITLTKSKCQLSLSPGTWSVRVIALGGAGEAEPCNPISVVVG